MSNAILMSGGADDIDFMIHGLFSYQLFGHTVWITTSHVCILIVMLVILIFAVIANRKIKHATPSASPDASSSSRRCRSMDAANRRTGVS